MLVIAAQNSMSIKRLPHLLHCNAHAGGTVEKAPEVEASERIVRTLGDDSCECCNSGRISHREKCKGPEIILRRSRFIFLWRQGLEGLERLIPPPEHQITDRPPV